MDKVNILDLDRKVLQSVDMTIKVHDDTAGHGDDDVRYFVFNYLLYTKSQFQIQFLC